MSRLCIDLRRNRLWPIAADRCRRLAAGIAVFVAAGAAVAGAVQAQTVREVNAEYDVVFNGVSIGTFEFNNRMAGQRYVARSNAKGRLLFGALKWTGNFSASGRIIGDDVFPRAFQQSFESRRRLAFRTKKNLKSATLEFSRNGSVNAKLNPPLKTHERVPLRPEHKRNVFDPIAAIIAITQTNVAKPCQARLPVFEGRQRFDILLKPKGRARLKDSLGRSYPGFVCAVRYVQVAGHRLKDDKSQLAKPGAIELVLRQVPEAELLVPHELRISTSMGSAGMKARKIDIRTNGRGRIVLSN
jgi:hypothetical protein